MHNKLVVILGPTSSGKSALGINLAKRFYGEIISADSRQVYRRMDLSTGKITKKEQVMVPHYLLDIASPKRQFTASDFQRHAKRAIAQIRGKDKVPFVVGGTPFYIYSLIDNLQIPEVKPNLKLRKDLEKKSDKGLFDMLKKLDPHRAKWIDQNNKRRLIRALEINLTTGKPVPVLSFPRRTSDVQKRESNNWIPDQVRDDILILGLKKDPKKIKKLIKIRLEKRLKQGMVKEIKKLQKAGVSYKRLFELGLESRFVSEYLQKKITYREMKEQLLNAIVKFSKRQMTWFKTDDRIKWVKNQKQAEKLVKSFLD